MRTRARAKAKAVAEPIAESVAEPVVEPVDVEQKPQAPPKPARGRKPERVNPVDGVKPEVVPTNTNST